jgi:hypothetical protein
MLRPFGSGMLMRTTMEQAVFRPSAETGVAAVGCEAAAQNVPESRQIEGMGRFAMAAKKAGLATYIHGLRTISLTTAAIAAGFDFVDGDVVTSVVDQPQAAYRFEITNLFENQFQPTG